MRFRPPECATLTHLQAADGSVPMWASTAAASPSAYKTPWPAHLAKPATYMASTLHGALSGNTEWCSLQMCFQGIPNSSYPLSSPWTSPQDDCCIAQQQKVASIMAGQFSVLSWSFFLAADLADLYNPGCENFLLAPAPRLQRLLNGPDTYEDLDMNGGGGMANIFRGDVGDTFDMASCGGWCPRSHPMCMGGQCIVPTCDVLRPYCDDPSPTGTRTRTYCARTCGCDDPASALALFTPVSGCSPGCTRPSQPPRSPSLFTTRLQSMPCEDASLTAGSNFERYLHSALNLSRETPSATQNMMQLVLPQILVGGCRTVGTISSEFVNVCAGDEVFPIVRCRLSIHPALGCPFAVGGCLPAHR
jgi:hypothetical protein